MSIFLAIQADDEMMQKIPFDPLQQESSVSRMRFQYNLVHQGSIFQDNPSGLTVSEFQKRNDLQTRGSEPRLWGSVTSEPQEGHLAEQRLTEDCSAVVPQQEGFHFTGTESNERLASQDSEQNDTQNANGLDLLLGNDSRKDGCCCDRGVADPSVPQVIHTADRGLPCSKKAERFDKLLSFAVADATHPEAMLCLCPSCGRNLSLNQAETHQLASTGEKIYRCVDCGYVFVCSTTDIAEHQLILTDEWEKLFSQLSLQSLPNEMDPLEEKPFKCPDCGKGFVRRSSIPRHQKLHRKESQSQHSGPVRSFSLGLKLISHQKTQAREKLFQFFKKKNLMDGNASKPQHCHRSQSATLCDVCGKSYALASDLRRHLATHLEVRPFRCADCGKGFTAKSTLLRHQLLHQPEKPFKCLFCSKGYIQKNHLNRHYQTVHHQYSSPSSA